MRRLAILIVLVALVAGCRTAPGEPVQPWDDFVRNADDWLKMRGVDPEELKALGETTQRVGGLLGGVTGEITALVGTLLVAGGGGWAGYRSARKDAKEKGQQRDHAVTLLRALVERIENLPPETRRELLDWMEMERAKEGS